MCTCSAGKWSPSTPSRSNVQIASRTTFTLKQRFSGHSSGRFNTVICGRTDDYDVFDVPLSQQRLQIGPDKGRIHVFDEHGLARLLARFFSDGITGSVGSKGRGGVGRGMAYMDDLRTLCFKIRENLLDALHGMGIVTPLARGLQLVERFLNVDKNERRVARGERCDGTGTLSSHALSRAQGAIFKAKMDGMDYRCPPRGHEPPYGLRPIGLQGLAGRPEPFGR